MKLAKHFSIAGTRDCDDLPASNSLLLKISKSGKHKQYNSSRHILVGVCIRNAMTTFFEFIFKYIYKARIRRCAKLLLIIQIIAVKNYMTSSF